MARREVYGEDVTHPWTRDHYRPSHINPRCGPGQFSRESSRDSHASSYSDTSFKEYAFSNVSSIAATRKRTVVLHQSRPPPYRNTACRQVPSLVKAGESLEDLAESSDSTKTEHSPAQLSLLDRWLETDEDGPSTLAHVSPPLSHINSTSEHDSIYERSTWWSTNSSSRANNSTHAFAPPLHIDSDSKHGSLYGRSNLRSGSSSSVPSTRRDQSISTRSSASTILSTAPSSQAPFLQHVAPNYTLLCEFGFLGCNSRFNADDFDEWVLHSLTHLPGKPPPNAECPICTTIPEYDPQGDIYVNWRERCIHIKGHFQQGAVIDFRELKPDFTLYSFLAKHDRLHYINQNPDPEYSTRNVVVYNHPGPDPWARGEAMQIIINDSRNDRPRELHRHRERNSRVFTGDLNKAGNMVDIQSRMLKREEYLEVSNHTHHEDTAYCRRQRTKSLRRCSSTPGKAQINPNPAITHAPCTTFLQENRTKTTISDSRIEATTDLVSSPLHESSLPNNSSALATTCEVSPDSKQGLEETVQSYQIPSCLDTQSTLSVANTHAIPLMPAQQEVTVLESLIEDVQNHSPAFDDASTGRQMGSQEIEPSIEEEQLVYPLPPSAYDADQENISGVDACMSSEEYSTESMSTCTADQTDWENSDSESSHTYDSSNQRTEGASSAMNHLLSAEEQLVERLMSEFWVLFNQNWRDGFRHRGPGQSSTTTSGVASNARSSSRSSYAPLNRKRARGKEADGPNDNDPRGSKRAGKQPARDLSLDIRYACPYRKHNPRKYCVADREWKLCALSSHATVARVKTHLYAYHTIHQCLRCQRTFDTAAILEAHVLAPDSCQLRTTEHVDGITSKIKDQLQCRKKAFPGQTEPERWMQIYKIILQPKENDVLPNPYFEPIHDQEPAPPLSPDSRIFTDFENYSRRELPLQFEAIISDAVSTELQPIREHFQRHLRTFLEEAQNRTFLNFRARFNLSAGSPSSQRNEVGEGSELAESSASMLGTFFQPLPPQVDFDPAPAMSLSDQEFITLMAHENSLDDSAYVSGSPGPSDSNLDVSRWQADRPMLDNEMGSSLPYGQYPSLANPEMQGQDIAGFGLESAGTVSIGNNLCTTNCQQDDSAMSNEDWALNLDSIDLE